jgi:hypothetical protein
MVFVLGEWRVTGLDVGGRGFVQGRRMGWIWWILWRKGGCWSGLMEKGGADLGPWREERLGFWELIEEINLGLKFWSWIWEIKMGLIAK